MWHKNLRIQLGTAVFLVVVGVGLLIAGFIVNPTGVIHPSVLTAFGEIVTFAGALFGVDYKYKTRLIEKIRKREDKSSSPAPENS